MFHPYRAPGLFDVKTGAILAEKVDIWDWYSAEFQAMIKAMLAVESVMRLDIHQVIDQVENSLRF
ncbi:hypothetical protein BGZ65_003358 [Modicella reniformis]|uniref:Uncharacterized protein n=1 Tax=Modicella reniformis TaxID=1440133 RepID=A0A9P6LZI0_9FUNG|nr:hypothetical protein BGZ65_003358 [Modicella reniformis]